MVRYKNMNDVTAINIDGYDRVEPGDTIDLDEEGEEDFEFYIERGDLVSAENADSGDGSSEETGESSGESGEETGEDDTAEVEDEAFFEQLKGLSYFREDTAHAVMRDFDDFEHFKEEVSEDYLADLPYIGEDRAPEVMEQLE